MKQTIGVGLVVVIALGGWLYYDFTKAVDGKTFRTWHGERVAAFKEMRRAFGPISDIAKGDDPYQQAIIDTSVVKLNDAAKAIAPLFKSVAPYGDASPEIWADNSNFNELMSAFVNRTEELVNNTPQDLATLRPIVDALRQDCADCHRKYKD
ncbi:cytochrome c [Marinobacterium sp. LSUCC0821]|uniref:c-type cytochrome n=1 Tax=Marinobacterium sp. LSUCC0821 TaxID=2668067 RepID=UPI0014523B9B|nr:cytochrome c [Marinobacterium sp. LSUCC0821]QJD70910.1 cytochrome c [Marinobacterium sp. LSUCC0821]